MYSKSKRFIAGFLAVLMAVCMLPVDMFGVTGVAFAAAAKPVAKAGETVLENNATGITTDTEITLSNADNDEIYYTTDGNDVDTSDDSQKYTAAFKLSAGEKTIKAVAVADGEESEPLGIHREIIKKIKELLS